MNQLVKTLSITGEIVIMVVLALLMVFTACACVDGYGFYWAAPIAIYGLVWAAQLYIGSLGSGTRAGFIAPVVAAVFMLVGSGEGLLLFWPCLLGLVLYFCKKQVWLLPLAAVSAICAFAGILICGFGKGGGIFPFDAAFFLLAGMETCKRSHSVLKNGRYFYTSYLIKA